MTTTQKFLVTATVSLAVGTGIFEAHRAHQMRAQLLDAKRQLQPLTAQTDQLRQERDQIAAKLQEAHDQIGQSDRDTAELLRLRGEVSLLRKDAQELAQLKKAATAASRPARTTAVDAQPSEPAETMK